ncbi:MAG: ATP-binding protein [Rhizomicrobium sp.]
MWHLAGIVTSILSVAKEHNASLVAVAAVLCVLSCYTALTLVARAGKPGKTSSDPWLMAAAVVVGCGVWAAHFVALLAFQPGLRIGYDPGQAMFAAAIGVVCCGCGFAAVVRGRPALGGAIVGTAAAAMNYAVMSALRLPAHEHWNLDVVAVSYIAAAALGAGALVLSARPRWKSQLAAAMLLSAGVLVTHFMGMAALSLTPDPSIAVPSEMIPPIWFSVAITAICILIMGLGVIGSLVDQHIAALETTKRELQETAEKLAITARAATAADQAKSQFLASMSHELRTPLNAILGFSEMLKDQEHGLFDVGRVRAYAASIFESGSHLLALIDEILDISKLDAGHLELHEEWLDLGAVVASCMQLMEIHAGKARVRLGIAVPESLPRLYADDRRIRQILLNLLSNAIKFTAEGGRVQVSISSDTGGMAVAVSDTGIGMSDGDIPVALARFGQIDSRLSRKHTGTGLGLPLSKGLAELHGGTLCIKSGAGVGTTVTVMFPPDRVVPVRKAA